MTWPHFALTVAAGLVCVLTPGFLVLAPARMTPIPRIAVAGLAGIGCAGVAAVVFGAVGMAWSPWQSLAPAGIGALLVAVGTRRTVRPAAPPTTWADAGLVAGLVLSGTVAALAAFWAMPDFDRPSQTYDNVFHMSAIARILDGGSASSLTLRGLIETVGDGSFYPSAWHVLVASIVEVTGAPPAAAANAAWVCVVVGIWAPGCAWLAQVLVPLGSRRLVACVATPLSIAFGSMPYALMTSGSLYPTFLATALLPASVALPLVCARIIRDARSMRQWRATVLGAAGTAGVVMTLSVAQPRVLISWVVLLAPAVAAGLWRAQSGAWRDRRRWNRRRWIITGAALTTMLVAGLSTSVLLAVRLQIFSRPLDERLSGPQAAADQSVSQALMSALLQAWPTGVPWIAPETSIVLALVVFGGLIAAVRTRGLRWVAAAYVGLMVLYALAAGSDGVFAKLATGGWYKDRYRLASVIPMLAVVLATFSLIIGARWLERVVRRPRVMAGAAVGAAVIVAATGVVSLAVPFGRATAEVLRLPEAPERGAVVGAKQMRFLSAIGAVVPPDERVLGDPWDGSAWSELLGGREAVFPHVNGQWDENRLVLAQDLASIDEDPRVCTALDALRVRYVVYNPHELGGGDPAGNHFPGPHLAVEKGLFALVLSDGESSLYRIDQCGPLPEDRPDTAR